jgi:hypothetical protein
MTIMGSLHSLSCFNDPCVCEPVYVRETPAETEQACDNQQVGAAWDQDASNVIEYTRTAPALAADPSLRRGFVVRGSGE